MARCYTRSCSDLKLGKISLVDVVELSDIRSMGDNGTGELVRAHHGQATPEFARCKDGICMAITGCTDLDKNFKSLRGPRCMNGLKILWRIKGGDHLSSHARRDIVSVGGCHDWSYEQSLSVSCTYVLRIKPLSMPVDVSLNHRCILL